MPAGDSTWHVTGKFPLPGQPFLSTGQWQAESEPAETVEDQASGGYRAGSNVSWWPLAGDEFSMAVRDRFGAVENNLDQRGVDVCGERESGCHRTGHDRVYVQIASRVAEPGQDRTSGYREQRLSERSVYLSDDIVPCQTMGGQVCLQPGIKRR